MIELVTGHKEINIQIYLSPIGIQPILGCIPMSALGRSNIGISRLWCWYGML